MDKFKIIPLISGHVFNHDRSWFVFRKHYDGERMTVPIIVWLLKSETQTILVDVGPGPKSSAPEYYTKTDNEHLLEYELQRVNVNPTKVDKIILTHLHSDHVGSVSLFPNATYYVQETELREAVWPVPFQRPLYEINQRGKIPVWTDVLDRMQVLYGDTQIIPGISVILLPGHTAGSQGVLVTTSKGLYLIAGDLIPLYDNWPENNQNPIPNGNHTDLRAYDASFRRIATLEVKVLPNHDPRIFDVPQYPE